MKRIETSRSNSRKKYTYRVICSFELQYTFDRSEVEIDPGGGPGHYEPTDAALVQLQADLVELIGQHYAVDKLDASAESDDLLGID